MQSNADTVEEYLASLPEDRRGPVSEVRDVINQHLPEGYVEQMDWGMISWVVPLDLKPDTYNGKPLCYAALASQKQHMSVYLMGMYTDGPELEWFRGAVRRARDEARHGQVLRPLQEARGPPARRPGRGHRQDRGGRVRRPLRRKQRSTMTELVHFGLTDGVATITLDSPHNRNALSRQLLIELFDALDRAEQDEDARVVLIRSAERVFCSGADLSEAADGGMDEGTKALVALQRRLVTHDRPIVTRLAGPVRAGGLGIVASSDIVLCSDDVTFAFTESRLALAPAVISLTVVPRLTSRAAAETFLTGRTFDASEAAAMGLVTRAVPADELDDAVTEVCSELKKAHPQGLRETKALLARDLLARIDSQADDMAALSARLFGSDEAREAMTAFLNRKK